MPRAIHMAAELLMAGKLVAFPTETVYGLGADASNVEAVKGIFRIKGRPAHHPLILHLPAAEQVQTGWDWAALAAPWGKLDDQAQALAQAFWPGPLTIIVKREPGVPAAVTGGLETVAIRVPSHPVARQLLSEFALRKGGAPAAIAAPSANRFGRVSPTCAAHVRHEFGTELCELGDTFEVPSGLAGGILDGGESQVGIESTIVDLSSKHPLILRPGSVTAEALEGVLGLQLSPLTDLATATRAPGLLAQHYAPRARVELLTAEHLERRKSELEQMSNRVYLLLPTGSAEEFAHSLYARLREADDARADVVLAVVPEGPGIAQAIRDRLARAAGLGQLPEGT